MRLICTWRKLRVDVQVAGSRRRAPPGAPLAGAVRPPRNRARLPAVDLPPQHLHNGGVDRKRGDRRRPRARGAEAAELRHRRPRELGEERRPRVESVRYVLEMDLAGAEADDLRPAALLREQYLPAARYHLARRRGAVAGLPLRLEGVVEELVGQAQHGVEEIQRREDDEAHHLVNQRPRHGGTVLQAGAHESRLGTWRRHRS